MNNSDIYIGFQFNNSVGKIVTVTGLDVFENKIMLSCPEWKKDWTNNLNNVEIFLRRGIYTSVSEETNNLYEIY